MESDSQLRCVGCGRSYPIINRIPSFVENGDPPARSTRTCTLSVVIPTLDEATSLRDLLPALARELEGLGISYEVIVVDGGSRDDTPEVAVANGARVETQQRPGFGGALRTGFERAGGDYS